MTKHAQQGLRRSGEDRILPYVRVLSAVIVPFLVLAFAVLYVAPGATERLFAWPIKATMTSMTLASAYLGGVYYFARVALVERRWHAVRVGLVPVVVFANLLGIATLLHWSVFSHDKLAFWLWAGLYLTTPFLVAAGFAINDQRAGRGPRTEPVLSARAAGVIGLVGLLALLQGMSMFLVPTAIIPYWPWLLTPLTARVVGAIFCLGCAGLLIWRDRRWSSLQLLLDVALIMIIAIMVAALRARAEFDLSRVLTWLLSAGFLGVLIGAVWLRVVMRRQTRPTGGNQ